MPTTRRSAPTVVLALAAAAVHAALSRDETAATTPCAGDSATATCSSTEPPNELGGSAASTLTMRVGA